MSGFSAEWLSLREPVDHRSANPALARELARHFADEHRISVVDLGCGTGSNLRATAHLLPAEQHWTLVDWDAKLLAAVDPELQRWSDRFSREHDRLVLEKAGRRIVVTLRQIDLARSLDEVLQTNSDLVTAAALFDLVSVDFITAAVRTITKSSAAFYTVLTYNGSQSWEPANPSDARLLEAFHFHQSRDKGFGPAVGPAAATHIAARFRREDYHVLESSSPWHLGPEDRQLIQELERGFADAVAETGKVDDATLEAWRAIRHTHAETGHTDILALPVRVPAAARA